MRNSSYFKHQKDFGFKDYLRMFFRKVFGIAIVLFGIIILFTSFTIFENFKNPYNSYLIFVGSMILLLTGIIFYYYNGLNTSSRRYSYISVIFSLVSLFYFMSFIFNWLSPMVFDYNFGNLVVSLLAASIGIYFLIKSTPLEP